MSHTAAVICIAGADPGQGAGLQMDQRVCEALGTAFLPVVALHTEQDAVGLKAVDLRPAQAVAADLLQALDQATACKSSVAIKTGALGNAEIVGAVAEVLRAHAEIPLVVDPVRRASRSHDPMLCLLTEAGWEAVVQELIPQATLLTPNCMEYGSGVDFAQCRAVLIKGGHANDSSAKVEDQLLQAGLERHSYYAERLIGATEIHGTGCALSTAISGFLAQGQPLSDAIAAARNYLQIWLAQAVARGSGGLLQVDQA